MDQPRVRPLAICVFRKADKIFVAEGYDPVKVETFYRPLGGEIDFGEYGHQTVAREIREEMNAQATDLRYLGAIENIFTFNGQPGHEVVLVYEGVFADKSMYDKDEVSGQEGEYGPFKAMWKPLQDFKNGQAKLYPEGLHELLMNNQINVNEKVET